MIGTSLQIIGERLCEAVNVLAGWKVLDVAAGNGNAALAAATRTSLRDELTQLANDHNRNQNAALTVDAEYLQVVATRH